MAHYPVTPHDFTSSFIQTPIKMLASEPPSSPPGDDTAPEDSLAWYKSQYEQLETELAEFRVSSEELEKELEKDLDAAEKRENALKEKAEGLVFEVDEWKVGSPLPNLRCRSPEDDHR